MIRRFGTKDGISRAVNQWIAPQIRETRGEPDGGDPAAVAAVLARHYERWGASTDRMSSDPATRARTRRSGCASSAPSCGTRPPRRRRGRAAAHEGPQPRAAARNGARGAPLRPAAQAAGARLRASGGGERFADAAEELVEADPAARRAGAVEAAA